MRRLLIIAIFFSLAILGQGLADQPTQNAIPPVSGKTKATTKVQNETDNQKNISINLSSPLNIVVSGKYEVTTKQDENKTNHKSAWWADPITWFTCLLVLVGIIQAIIYNNQLVHFRRTDRAYVRISSNSPGVVFSEGHPIRCAFTIKNCGETPAHITDIVIKAELTPIPQLLPYPPDYRDVQHFPCSDAYLVRNDSLSYGFEGIQLTANDLTAIEKMEKTISLYGYVDYIDAFGERHRGQYGQNYWKPNDNKGEGMSNLTFLMQKGYNEDRPRKKGEGNDWNYNQSFNPIRG